MEVLEEALVQAAAICDAAGAKMKTMLKEGMDLIELRQKMIKLADCSD